MVSRTIGTLAFALGLMAAEAAYLPQAHASPVQAIPVEYDLTITFAPPPDPNANGPPIFPNLTGFVTFTTPLLFNDVPTNFAIGGFGSIGTLIPGNPVIPGNPIFTGRFIPG